MHLVLVCIKHLNRFFERSAGCAGETASAVLILESAVRQYEDILGIRHPGISILSKKAEKLLANLESEQREQVG